MEKWFHPTRYLVRDYLFMLGLKLIHVSKRGSRNTPKELHVDVRIIDDQLAGYTDSVAAPPPHRLMSVAYSREQNSIFVIIRGDYKQWSDIWSP